MCEPGLLAEQASEANRNVPIFIAHGTQDPVVPPILGEMACKALQEAGYTPEFHEYPMQHNVCMKELEDISAWLQQRLA